MAFAAGDSKSLAITSDRKCTSLTANKSDLYYLCMNTQIEYYYIFRFSAACKSSKLLKHISQKCRLKCNGQCAGKKKTCGLNLERKTLPLCVQFYLYPRIIKNQYEMRIHRNLILPLVIYICYKNCIFSIQCKLRTENRFTYMMGKAISFPGITRKMHFRYHNIGNKTFFKQSGL